MTMVDAVVLAGGDGAVIDPRCRFKGLLPVGGRPMVEWVVDAMRAAETVNDVVAVVPSSEGLGSWVADVGAIVESDGSFISNIIAGIEALERERPVLLATGDIPAITPEAIDDFVEAGLKTGADVVYPLVRKEDIMAQFPGSERTYVTIAAGQVTGGNLMLVNPAVVLAHHDIGGKLFAARKNPLSMARVIGMRFVVKLALGRLDVHEVERKLGEMIGGRGAAVFTRHASVGADIDKPVDVVVTERVLLERSRRASAG